MADTYELSGRVALVTGGGAGIGFETARQLHARGASVAILDIDGAAAEEAAASMLGGERTLAIAADVTDSRAMVDAVAATVERFGGLDIAVANAGIAPPFDTARTIDSEAWERVLDVNLLGVWHTVRAAIPQVIERRGQLVLVASVYAFMNGVFASSYATAKAGVEALGRSLRVEMAAHGASATVAYFGFIETKMTEDAFASPVAQQLRGWLPATVTKMLEPSEAGAAIVRGIEDRSPRVVAPAWWKPVSALRGIAGPLLDRRMVRDAEMAAIVRLAEQQSIESRET